MLSVGRTSTVTPSPWYKRGKVDGTPPLGFAVLQFFTKILPLMKSCWCALQDEVNVMACDAAGSS